MKKISAIILVSSFMGLGLKAQPVDDISNRILRSASVSESLYCSVWDNPVINTFAKDYTINSIHLQYTASQSDKAIKMREGNSYRIGEFNAESYMKHKNSTLWGKAFYNTGNITGIKWSAVSDAERLYPYILGGEDSRRRYSEHYSFFGGYGIDLGTYSFAAQIGYTARQDYQKVDPRPKNITSDFNIAAGAARRIAGDLLIGISLSYEKYKQTNDVDFYNEFGQDKLYHFTGLGMAYSRFTGTGYATFYNAHDLGTTIFIYPAKGTGFMASLGYKYNTCNNIIEDLNHLPMSNLKQSSINAIAGFKTGQFGLIGNTTFLRKTGRENIFGDAASQVYPVIGSLDMYSENYWNCSITGVWESRTPNHRFSIKNDLALSHSFKGYSLPAKELSLDAVSAGLSCSSAFIIGKRFVVDTSIGYSIDVPFKSNIEIGDPATPTNEADYSDFVFASNKSHTLNVRAACDFALSAKYAIGIALNYSSYSYTQNVKRNRVSVDVNFKF